MVSIALTKAAAGKFYVGYMGGTYLLTVTNTGTKATEGPITCTDPLPTGLSYVSSSGPGWSCSERASTVSCAYDAILKPGQSALLTLHVTVGPGAAPMVENVAFAETAGMQEPSAAEAMTAVAAAAPAPVLSPFGLGLAIAGLLFSAGIAFARRR